MSLSDWFKSKVDPIEKLPWMRVAYKYIGLHEIAGPKSDPKIVEWLTAVGARGSDDVAWCAAACNGVLREAGYVDSGRANARSLLGIGEELSSFKPGCIVILWRTAANGWQGHVGFGEKLSDDGKYVRILGGNQGDEFNSAWFSASRVLGYRWPVKR